MAVREIDYYSSCASGEIPDNATLKLFSSDTFTNFGCFLTLRKLSWLPCGTKFLRGFNFCDFSSDLQKSVPANKNYRKDFSRKNLLQSKYSPT